MKADGKSTQPYCTGLSAVFTVYVSARRLRGGLGASWAVFMCVDEIELRLLWPSLAGPAGERSRCTSIHHAVTRRLAPGTCSNVVGCLMDSWLDWQTAGCQRPSVLRNTLTDLIGPCEKRERALIPAEWRLGLRGRWARRETTAENMQEDLKDCSAVMECGLQTI